MDTIIKAFVTLICLIIVTFSVTGLIVGASNSSMADSFLSDCARVIEEGNFQDSIISDCVAEATNKNYTLNAEKKDTNGDGYTDMVNLTLEYSYQIPYLNATANTKTIKAYAR